MSELEVNKATQLKDLEQELDSTAQEIEIEIEFDETLHLHSTDKHAKGIVIVERLPKLLSPAPIFAPVAEEGPESSSLAPEYLDAATTQITNNLFDAPPLLTFNDDVIQVTGEEPTFEQLDSMILYMSAFGINDVDIVAIRDFISTNKNETVQDFLGYEAFDLTALSSGKISKLREVCSKRGGKHIANFLGYEEDSWNPNNKDPNSPPNNNFTLPTKISLAKTFAPDVQDYLLKFNYEDVKKSEASLELKLPVVGLSGSTSHYVIFRQNDTFRDMSIGFHLPITVTPILWVHWTGSFFVTFKNVVINPYVDYSEITKSEDTLERLEQEIALTTYQPIDKTIVDSSGPLTQIMEKERKIEAYIDLDIRNILPGVTEIPTIGRLGIKAKCAFYAKSKIEFEYHLPKGHHYHLKASKSPFINIWHV